jgi:hypothetical protein
MGLLSSCLLTLLLLTSTMAAPNQHQGRKGVCKSKLHKHGQDYAASKLKLFNTRNVCTLGGPSIFGFLGFSMPTEFGLRKEF